MKKLGCKVGSQDSKAVRHHSLKCPLKIYPCENEFVFHKESIKTPRAWQIPGIRKSTVPRQHKMYQSTDL